MSGVVECVESREGGSNEERGHNYIVLVLVFYSLSNSLDLYRIIGLIDAHVRH